jgi:hypothetical protein
MTRCPLGGGTAHPRSVRWSVQNRTVFVDAWR